MALANNIPVFNEVTGGTIGLTTATLSGPTVSAQLARFCMNDATSTITVNIGCDSAGAGGLTFTGGDAPVPFLVDNLNRIYMKASGNVTINFTVER